MNFRPLAAIAGALALLAPSAHAQAAPKPVQPRYRFTAGQALRYLIQRDPYFADPQTAIETASPDAPYRPPAVERLTERVQAVGADGTATLRLTLGPEPGFEDPDHPQPPRTRTVTVGPDGQVSPVSGTTLGSDPAEYDLLRGIVPLAAWVTRPGTAGLIIGTRTLPPTVTRSKSPGHDGTLLQTTRAAETDRAVFDVVHGQLAREVCTLTVTLTLVMTARGRRGSDDFGHVIPNAQVVQTLTVERQTD